MPTLEILAILLLTLANGAFALSEIAVVSARKARLQAAAEEGNRKARAALLLANNPNDFLSVVQIGITLIGTLAGAFGGATLAAHLGAYLNAFRWIAPHGESLALGIVVVLISYLSLILGELAPKQLALSNPERYAALVAPPMRTIARLASPAVRFLTWSTDMVFRVIPIRHENQQTVTEEEVRQMIEQGTETGTFDEAEQEMVEGVFRLGDRRVSELMTPRQNIAWIDLHDSPDAVRETLRLNDFSRFLVADGDLDQVRGFVHVKDLLNESLAGKSVEIGSVLRTAPVVFESMRALRALEVLKSARSHIAFVVDEHGGIEGLITVTDLMQAVVGEVPTSAASAAGQAVQREDGSWLIDGMMPAYEL